MDDSSRWWFTDVGLLLALALVGVALVIAVWDVFTVFRGWPEDSVSYTIQRWSHDWPMFTLAVGILIGHLFWSIRFPK